MGLDDRAACLGASGTASRGNALRLRPKGVGASTGPATTSVDVKSDERLTEARGLHEVPVAGRKRRRTSLEATLSPVLLQTGSWLFSPAFLWHALDGRHRNALRDLGITAALNPAATLVEMYQALYAEMLRSYRGEYVYKNELIRRIFEQRHDPDDAALVLEKRIAGGDSRVDVLVVNDTLTAYEIKSDRDSLARVQHQTALALDVFDRVVVACSGDFVLPVRAATDERVGILRLRPDGSFATVRRPRPNAANVVPHSIFSVLQRAEYVAAIEAASGPLPNLNAAEQYEYCKEQFGRLNPRASHRILLAALRKRYVRIGHRSALKGATYALAHLYYKLTPKERATLFVPSVLQKSIG